MKGPERIKLERGHLRWLAGVMGVYTLSDPPELEVLLAKIPALELLKHPEGSVIIREGDRGGELFILYSGSTIVQRGGKTVATLNPGALIGEMGFVFHSPRTATVLAGRGCEIFRIPEIGSFLREFPAIEEFLQDTARRRISELERVAEISRTDPKPAASMPAPAKPLDPSLSRAAGRPSAPEPVRLLGKKYRLLGRIGQGAMGAVLEGYDQELERRVAVKKVHDDISDDPNARSYLIQEAKLIAKLTHPFIVGIHEVLEDAGQVYLIFDFVEGRTLADLISERGCLLPEDCKVIMTYVCQAVACAHWNRIFHRDLKPANIMLDVNGYVKVMDFGLARRVKDSRTKLTQKDISGTPLYMAPEHHLGSFAAASDVYSLGVCLFEMLAGEVPFKGPDLLAQKERRLYPAPSSVIPGADERTDGFFREVLEPDPEKRTRGAMELLAGLKKL